MMSMMTMSMVMMMKISLFIHLFKQPTPLYEAHH